MRSANILILLALLAGGVSCAGGGAPSLPGGLLPQQRSSGSSPIKHVVIVIQENRSFDNFFATFPGADGTTVGKAAAMPQSIAESCPKPITAPTTIPLTEVDLQGHGFPSSYGYQTNADLGHLYANFRTNYDSGKMDGFDLGGYGARGSGGPSCTYPYQYVNPKDIQPYWDMAQQYVLSDHMFQTQGSGSFTAHQDLIAGGTGLSSEEALIDTPTYFPWGCDGNPQKLRTAVIKRG
ncbi:MAG TPA: alkaline phosphatase family protein, partial [Candidatus Cybelea sp.]|nr:alkaline phosphatase family protein [Candidatus Cybelea sp.]